MSVLRKNEKYKNLVPLAEAMSQMASYIVGNLLRVFNVELKALIHQVEQQKEKDRFSFGLFVDGNSQNLGFYQWREKF